MDVVIVCVIIGVVLSAVLSTVFGVYSKATATPYIRTLFGMSSIDLISGVTLAVIIAAFFLLAVVSGLIRDLTYPTKSPLKFAIEVLLMGFLPALVFLLMAVFRGYPINSTVLEEFGMLLAKFSILHVLLQFSGFYSFVFPPK